MRVCIVGGGVIGLSVAQALLGDGHEVVIVERGPMLEGCSMGNSGLVVPSHFVPLASPGIVAQGVKWLANSKSPFTIRPSLNPSLVRWGLLFRSRCTPEHADTGSVVLHRLLLESRAMFGRMPAEAGVGFSERGLLLLCRTTHGAAEEEATALKAKSLGLDVEVRDASGCQQLEPLSRSVGGAFYPLDAQVDPALLMGHLFAEVSAAATVIENAGEASLHSRGSRVRALTLGDRDIEADEFVLAAGSWSGRLAATLGLELPLMPGKGYSFVVPAREELPGRPLILVEDRVAVSPLPLGVRFGGTMEIGTPPDETDMRRVHGIAEAAPRYLAMPRFEPPQKEAVWRGLRPCSPDGLPYIGRTAAASNLIVATGHAMLGLSLAPVTGRIVADLVGGRSVSIEGLSPDRFA